MQIAVKQAWIERRWGYASYGYGTKILDYDRAKYQLCVNTISNNLNGFDVNWSIGNNKAWYLHRSSQNSLIGDLNTMPGDTIFYNVQKGEFIDDTNKMQIIGHFVLVKK